MGYLAAMTRYFPALNSTKDHLLILQVRLVLLLMWTSALAFLSLASDVRVPSGLLGWDKFNHFAAYTVLALLLANALGSLAACVVFRHTAGRFSKSNDQ